MNLKSCVSLVLHVLLILSTRRVIPSKRPKLVPLFVPLVAHGFSNLPIMIHIKLQLHYTPDLTNWDLSLTLVPELFRNPTVRRCYLPCPYPSFTYRTQRSCRVPLGFGLIHIISVSHKFQEGGSVYHVRHLPDQIRVGPRISCGIV
jgi:hypothetical protein